ncbi:hypothetical protein AB0C96_04305 [Streptomyces sp. NPDC048506]|uniref:hypothetical protein n=1 Tax=Streptomyces sp. NPDC048506 TaxID=3155028 RepID=UPI00342FCA23
METDLLVLDEELDPRIDDIFGQRISKVQQDVRAIEVQQGGTVLSEAQMSPQDYAVPTGPEPRADTNSRFGVLPPDDVLVDRPLDVVLARLRGTIPAPPDRGVTERGPDIRKPRTSGKPCDLHQFDQQASIMQHPRRCWNP